MLFQMVVESNVKTNKLKNKMETIKFFATMGVTVGYTNANEFTNDVCLEMVSTAWQNESQQVFEETGIYIGAVISSSKTVYSKNWGCPEGGENTCLIIGEANPNFIKDLEAYKNTVLDVLAKVKKSLNQSTCQITFQKSEMFYLN